MSSGKLLNDSTLPLGKDDADWHHPLPASIDAASESPNISKVSIQLARSHVRNVNMLATDPTITAIIIAYDPVIQLAQDFLMEEVNFMWNDIV